MQEPTPLPSPDPKAVQRTQLLLEVLSGKLTATQAAEQLGVSRKTWHEWQERGLSALMDAMRDRPTGRPAVPVDPEKERLARELVERQRELSEAERTRYIQSLLRPLPPLQPGSGCKKKP